MALILVEECTNDGNLLGGVVGDYEERSCETLYCLPDEGRSLWRLIHSSEAELWEQSWSPHLRSFHLKLSAASFLSPPPLTVLHFSPLLFLTPVPVFFSYFTLSLSLLLFLLGWEEVTRLFLDPWGIDRWSSLSCNPFFIRHLQTC